MPRKTERKPQETRELDWTALVEHALTAPGSLSSAYSRFYSYSFMNTLYLYMQGVVPPAATYERWKGVGRQVLKGSKAAEIVRPIVIEKKDDSGEVEGRILKFKLVKCMFGFDQTDGEELPPVEVPGWDLDTALTKLDIKRGPFTSMDGNVQGHSQGREFAVNPVAANPLKTTFHELGHIALGHTVPGNEAEYLAHRGRFEFQAETTAYLTMNDLGQLDEQTASESRGYVQHWLRNQRPADSEIKPIFGAVDSLLKAGRPE